MASIRKRSWITAGEPKHAWIVDYRDQHRTRRMKTFARKKDADAWAIQTGHEIGQGTHVAERASIGFAQAAALWLAKGDADGLEASTIDQRRQHVDLHLVPLLHDTPLVRLQPPRLQEIRDILVATLSHPLARKVLTSLKAIFGEALRRGYVAQNAASAVKIDLRTRNRRKMQIPSKDDIRAILANAEGRWRPLLVTAVFTGLRASELRGLRWADVDLDGRILHVTQRADRYNVIGRPKSVAGERAVPLSPMVVNTLREWRLACPPGQLDLVFPNGAGHIEALANIHRRGFGQVQIEAGIVDGNGKPRWSMHDLRHFCASFWIDQGFPPKKIQGMMGHASITMTFDLYGHLFPTDQNDFDRIAAGERQLMG